ncbi:MAG: transposase [Gemmatimonadetes bacterium]|nr:transposase [Gemmatimonadota bacterium]
MAVDGDTGEVLAEDPTNRHTADCVRVPKLLDQIDGPLTSVAADGAYDAGSVYEAVQGKGDGHRVTTLIPPGRGAQPSSIRSPGQRERNRNIRSMRKLGRQEWYAGSGYSRRSLVENTVFRYKTILGQRMRSRSLGSQRAEVRLACRILNTMTSLGMPDSVKAE